MNSSNFSIINSESLIVCEDGQGFLYAKDEKKMMSYIPITLCVIHNIYLLI